MWNKLVSILRHFWQVIVNWFLAKELAMQNGELVVSGKNSISIPLNGFPSEHGAKFIDVCQIVPCNLQDVDYLECDVHTSNSVKNGFVLVISWSVSGTREIEWHAYY
jgi:hypothetical protein